jgi:hypothetical protein
MESTYASRLDPITITLAIFSEIFFCIIDNLIRTKRAYQLSMARAAHAGHFSPDGFGNLHGKRADPTRSAINQHVLPLLESPCSLDDGSRLHFSLVLDQKRFDR